MTKKITFLNFNRYNLQFLFGLVQFQKMIGKGKPISHTGASISYGWNQEKEAEIIYKEHPLNNYQGTEEPRDWMFGVTGYYPSFFGFWKKCQKELKEWNQPTLFG